MKSKLVIFLSILPAILIPDVLTKRWALSALGGGRTIELFDGLVPLTLAFNRGGAFGISIGGNSRWVFIPIVLVALALLVLLLHQAGDRDRLRIHSLSLIMAGAVGNLIDRLRWDVGVVDFIGPIHIPVIDIDWPIFNIADMAITCGAVLLAISFWREERRTRAKERSDERRARERSEREAASEEEAGDASPVGSGADQESPS